MATSSIEVANLFNVNGLVAVITGGGTGIGLMMSRALALNGAHKVYIIGRRKEVLEKAAQSVSTGNIIPLVGDVTSKQDLSSIIATITADVGYINVLVANSGIAGPQAVTPITATSTLEDFKKSWGESSFEDYVETFKINTAAVWYCIMGFLALLDAGNKKRNVTQTSQVIATTSIGAFNRCVPGGYAYGQSKAATTHLIKQLATGLVSFDIRCNVIAPGIFPSEMAAAVVERADFPKEQIPLQRPGAEEEMAGCILFLTSKAGAYCTGNVTIIDGGRLSVMPATY